MTREGWGTLRTAIRVFGFWIPFTVCIYFTTNMFITLAEKGVIDMSILVSGILNISGSVQLSWTITGGALIYGYLQKRLRRKNTKYFQKYADDKHRKHWPEKISSGINSDGTLKKEDQL